MLEDNEGRSEKKGEESLQLYEVGSSHRRRREERTQRRDGSLAREGKRIERRWKPESPLRTPQTIMDLHVIITHTVHTTCYGERIRAWWRHAYFYRATLVLRIWARLCRMIAHCVASRGKNKHACCHLAKVCRPSVRMSASDRLSV